MSRSKAADLAVDDPRGVFAEIPWQGYFAVQKDVFFAAMEGERAEFVAHTPMARHLPGKARRFLEIVLRRRS